MRVESFTNTILYSGEDLYLTNSFVGLDGVEITSMNVLVTNTLSGRYTNAYSMRGAAITFWASNTYDVYSLISPTLGWGMSFGTPALVQCPEQLNARYYMLKYLNGTWELPAVRNKYLHRNGTGLVTNQPWGDEYPAPATSNNFLDYVGWFTDQEAIGVALARLSTNYISYNLLGQGLSSIADGVDVSDNSSWDGMNLTMSWNHIPRLGEEHAYLHAHSKIKGKTGELYRKFGTEIITVNNVVSNRPMQGYQQLDVVNLSDPIVDTNFPFYSYERPTEPWTLRYKPLNGQYLGIGDSVNLDYWNEDLSESDFSPWGWMYYSGGWTKGKNRWMNYYYQKGQNFYKALVYWDFQY
jgi:hypothetical protein